LELPVGHHGELMAALVGRRPRPGSPEPGGRGLSWRRPRLHHPRRRCPWGRGRSGRGGAAPRRRRVLRFGSGQAGRAGARHRGV